MRQLRAAPVCLPYGVAYRLSGIFDYEPGSDVSELPPLRTVTAQELSLSSIKVAF